MTLIKQALLLLSAAILLTACGGQTKPTAAAKPQQIKPKTEIFWGIFTEELRTNLKLLDKMDKIYGKKPAMVMWYTDWRGDFPDPYCSILDRKGYMPHIVWEPWYAGDQNSMKLSDILSGKWDAYIQKWGKAAGEYGKPVMVRWGHEMNGNWYPWSGPKNGNSPETYVKTYIYVHDMVVKAGATNIIWLWSPNCDSAPGDGFNLAKNYYPGSAYVDWVAVDGYNWGTSQSWSSWKSFDSVFSSAMSQISSYAPDKPVMIGEFGCSSVGGDKPSWIKDFFVTVKDKYPQIRAWIWFDISKETDWRFDSDKDSLEAFKTGVSDPVYSTNIQSISTLHQDFVIPHK